MLECPKCGHDNDLGRIFCVKCGDKLDISKVAPPTRVVKEKKRAAAGTKSSGTFVIHFLKIIFIAALCAIFTLLWFPPPFEVKNFDLPELNSYLAKHALLDDDAVRGHREPKLVFTEAELNAAMAQFFLSSNQDPQEKGLKLESIYIQPGNQFVTVMIQNKFYWFRLNLQVKAYPEKIDEKWRFKVDTIWIGRLPLPAVLRDKVSDVFLNRVWAAFKKERELLEKMESVEFKPGELILVTRRDS